MLLRVALFKRVAYG